VAFCFQSSIRAAAAGAIGLASLLVPLSASAAVLPPDQSYGGRSQYAWSALWWQTFLEAPAANNPLLSSSDSSALTMVNSKDPAMVFLTGTGDGTPIDRSLTLTTGQALFFPVVNYSETDPFVADECGFATAVIDSMIPYSIVATLNGSPLVPNILGYRQGCASQPGPTPGGFSLNIESGDYYNAPPYPAGEYQAASDGYWLLLEPLPPGNHVLSFGGDFLIGEFDFRYQQSNTYRLQIQGAPGPLPLSGLAAAFAFSRRQRRLLLPRPPAHRRRDSSETAG
jgi:hypothetical protein